MGSRRAMSAFDEHGAQGLASHARAGGPALAGAFAVAGTEAGPCREPVGGAEGAEVVADLGEDGAGRGAIDPGDSLEKQDAVFPRHEAVVDIPVEPLNTLLQRIMLAQQIAQDQAVGRAEGEAKGIADPLNLVHDMMAERGQDGVPFEPLGQPVENPPSVHPEDVGENAADARTAAVENLLHPVAHSAALADQGTPVVFRSQQKIPNGWI